MGEVYRARDTRLDRTAIKILAPALAADSELRERFEREARQPLPPMRSRITFPASPQRETACRP
jgi:serine/threonine protein kinase